MSDACFFEFLEIVQHSTAESPLIVAKLGILFSNRQPSLCQVVIEQITVGESDLDHRALCGESSKP